MSKRIEMSNCARAQLVAQTDNQMHIWVGVVSSFSQRLGKCCLSISFWLK